MKRLLIVAVIMLPSVVYGAGRILTDASNGYPVQVFTPDPEKSVAVTSSISRTFDNSYDLAISFTPAADCKGRHMPTASKGTYPQFTLKGGSEYRVGVKRERTGPFFNISGCTGDYQAQ